MEKSQKIKIAIGLSLIAIASGTLYYLKIKKTSESQALLDYIATLPKMNTAQSVSTYIDKNTEQAVSEIESVAGQKFDMNGMALGNIVLKKGDKSNIPQFLEKAKEIAKNLHDSMSGAGTNENLFYSNLMQIKNKKTLSWMDAYYRVIYKTNLFKDIRGELKLYTGNAQSYVPDFFIPSEITKYALKLSKYLINLK